MCGYSRGCSRSRKCWIESKTRVPEKVCYKKRSETACILFRRSLAQYFIFFSLSFWYFFIFFLVFGYTFFFCSNSFRMQIISLWIIYACNWVSEWVRCGAVRCGLFWLHMRNSFLHVQSLHVAAEWCVQTIISFLFTLSSPPLWVLQMHSHRWVNKYCWCLNKSHDCIDCCCCRSQCKTNINLRN